MTAHVRRGGPARTKARKPVQVPKKIVKRLPLDQQRANSIARYAFGTVLLLIVGLVIGGLARRHSASETEAEAGRSDVRRLHRVAELVASGAEESQIIIVDQVGSALAAAHAGRSVAAAIRKYFMSEPSDAPE